MANHNQSPPAQGQNQAQQLNKVQRDWPTAHATWAQIEQNSRNTSGSNTYSGTSSSSNQNMTPMQRWGSESSTQSSWNNIGYVAAGSSHGSYGQTNGRGSSGTDDGTWFPSRSAGK